MNKRQKKKQSKRFYTRIVTAVVNGRCRHVLVTRDTFKKGCPAISAFELVDLNPIAYNPPDIGAMMVYSKLPTKFINSLTPDNYKRFDISNLPNFLGLLSPGEDVKPSYREFSDTVHDCRIWIDNILGVKNGLFNDILERIV